MKLPHHFTARFGRPTNAVQENGTIGTKAKPSGVGSADGFAVWWKRSQYQISKNKYAIIMIAAHMPRHATGYVLANKGTDTRTLQSYLGHQSIQSTVRYTELAPGRFKNLWR